MAPLGWLLWPLTLVVGPFLAIDAGSFFLALGPALAVVTLHYLWVVNTAVAFEDASVDYAQKRGARVAAWRSGLSFSAIVGSAVLGLFGCFTLSYWLFQGSMVARVQATTAAWDERGGRLSARGRGPGLARERLPSVPIVNLLVSDPFFTHLIFLIAISEGVRV